MKAYFSNVQSIWIITYLIAKCGNCDGQEKPLYTIPNFSNESVRQDFCSVHRLVEDGQIHRRDALRGKELRPVFFKYQLNATTGAIDTEDPDLSVVFLDELARRAGFHWRNSYGVADEPTANQTWTDVLLWAGSKYDMVGEWFIRNEDRVGLGVLFSEPWVDADLIMVKKIDVKEDDGKSSFFNFLRPFTYGLWGLIGLTLIATGLVYYLLDYIDSRRHSEEMDLGFRDSMFNAAWLFTGHTLHNPNSSATRLLVFSCSFLCLLTVAAYTANLVNFLVTENAPEAVIKDINDVIRNDLVCCVEASSPSYDFMRKYHPMVKLVATNDVKPATEVYHALARSECDIALTEMSYYVKRTRSEEYNPNCNLVHVGRSIHDNQGCFPLMDSSKVCASLISEVLTLYILEMKRDGTFRALHDRYLDGITTNSCSSVKGKQSNNESISVGNMYGIFILHFAAVSAAFMFATLRLCHNRLKRKRASEAFQESIRRSVEIEATDRTLPITSTVESATNVEIEATDRTLPITSTVESARQSSFMEAEENTDEWVENDNLEAAQPNPSEADKKSVSFQLQDLQNEMDERENMFMNFVETMLREQLIKYDEHLNQQFQNLEKKVN